MQVTFNPTNTVALIEDENGVVSTFNKDWLETAYIAWMYETNIRSVSQTMRELHELTLVGASAYARAAKRLHIRGIDL